MSRFSIKSIISQDEIGEDLTLIEVSRTFNNRGDETETLTNHTITGHVDEMSGDEDIVTEGILGVEDLTCFFDEDEPNVKYLVGGNRLKRNSKEYVIKKDVIKNPGHYEVHAQRT